MNDDAEAGAMLYWAWREGRTIDALPAACRPADVAAGYRVQDALVEIAGEPVAGYKIAATSAAGQTHLKVDHPIAGRLLMSRVLRGDGQSVPIAHSRMGLAEVEFAFALADDLPPREDPYEVQAVMVRVAALHLALELPDTRYGNVALAGAPQITADNACADWFVLGPAVEADWRGRDLARHEIRLTVNGEEKTSGRGGDALGDPRLALTWLANLLAERGEGLKAGQVVTTGVCGAPVPVRPGDEAIADYGDFGRLSVQFI